MNTKPIFAAILVLAFPANAMADCANDNDCKGDRICESGVCVSPSVTPDAQADFPRQLQPPPPEPPPRTEGALVRFFGKPGKSYTVTITTSDIVTETVSRQDSTHYGARTVTPRTTHTVGANSSTSGARAVTKVGEDYSCLTPCELTVPPGLHRVTIGGDGNYSEVLTIPNGRSKVTIEHQSNGLVWTGWIGLSLGIPISITSITLGALATSGDTALPSLILIPPGVILTVTGAICLGVSGNNRMKIEGMPIRHSSGKPRVQLLGIGAAPTGHGGGMMGATFSF